MKAGEREFNSGLRFGVVLVRRSDTTPWWFREGGRCVTNGDKLARSSCIGL